MAEDPGLTASERYVYRLCRKTFLQLWSYPNVYRDQGKCGERGAGKEVCDLLVVCGEDAIVFSVKECKFGKSADLHLNWRRWYDRAIRRSVNQVFGAERFIRQFPDKLFCDPLCTTPLPIRIGAPAKCKIHRVVVALGIRDACRAALGGSGSLMLAFTQDRSEDGNPAATVPFAIGHPAPERGFVHVLDDTSLDVVLGELDTVSDLIAYFEAKERLCNKMRFVSATGEEELLAHYVRHVNDQRQHDLVFPENVNGLALDEGIWESTRADPQYMAKKKADRISYWWDHIIERFSQHLMEGTLLEGGERSVIAVERALRVMAKEGRFERRMLTRAFLDLISRTPPNRLQTRTVIPEGKSIGYVFTVYPETWEFRPQYREVRSQFLRDYCLVVVSQVKGLKQVVGIGTEAGAERPGRSEDLVYVDRENWTPELDEQARSAQEQLGIWNKQTMEMQKFHASEYPSMAATAGMHGIVPSPAKKPRRNGPCPCGSGRKYKKCCGSR